MKVGIPCMKCSMNPSTQVNKKTGKAAKTCGVGSAWREMNDERLGRDTTIDKSLTENNVWNLGSTSDNVEEIVKNEIERINEERRDAGLRAMRKDAVSVIEIVEKPPIDFMENLSYEDKVKFLNDSHECMKELIAEWNDIRNFTIDENGNEIATGYNQDWKIIESVQHHDEFGGLSAHNHELVLLSSTDENGIANMNAKTEFNLKFFSHINNNYPEKMRERGYEVEDCLTYDRLSEEEKEERRLHPEEHGVEAYKYKAKKEAEMKEKLAELETKIVEISEAPDIESYTSLQEENKNLKEEISLKDKVIEKLQETNEKLQETLETWKERAESFRETISDITHKAGEKLMGYFGYEVKDNSISEYPSKEISEGFKEMQGAVSDINIKNYRALPDLENEGKFRVAYLNKDGEYLTVKSGFDTREDAENWKRDSTQKMESISESKDIDKGLQMK